MEAFNAIANRVAKLSGHPLVFVLAVLSLLLWAASGFWFGFSDTWQLVVNSLTSIVTFLMVFLIQNTQNRDSEALHLKLDELLRAIGEADTRLCNLQERSEAELGRLRERYRRLAAAEGASRLQGES